MIHHYYIPSVNIMGAGAISKLGEKAKSLGCKKALIVTDKTLHKVSVLSAALNFLDQEGLDYVIYEDVHPNPSVENVEAGLAIYQNHQCNLIIAIGGGSSIDCAKAIGILATNGGSLTDYEGVDKTWAPSPNLIAVNTTAGTASELTRFTIITDQKRKIKMDIVDWRVTPTISINDPHLMEKMPPKITASTGMDALTHAIEAYVSTNRTPITDATAIKAIEIIAKSLPIAVTHGHDIDARENMIYGEFMAGMAFNNSGLGLVHAMAHQLGSLYKLSHGILNAVLLPYVSKFNAEACPERYVDIGLAMGLDMAGVPQRLAAKKTCDAIKNLANAVGIPPSLTGLGVKEKDFPLLAEHAMQDLCSTTNPRKATHADIVHIFKDAM